jgi:DNA-binding beta-propeller fold protein YncE
MYFGTQRVEGFRGAAFYVDGILKGEKPGDLLVQLPTKYLAGRPSRRQQGQQRPREFWPGRQDLGRSLDQRGLYRADGYLNKRVAVIDADTGVMKRYWGAYGNKPDDSNLGPYNPAAPPAQQFRNPVHCIERSVDNLVYVCDRQNDRLQVFKPDGTFVKEKFFAKNTRGAGSVWDIVFSKDPEQKFLMLADGQNERVRVIVRDTLEEITSFGDGGRQPGQFYGVHSIASDSKGNLYTTETYEGKRVQKFNYKGIGSVPLGYQGVLWPKKS